MRTAVATSLAPEAADASGGGGARYWVVSQFAGTVDLQREWTAASDVGREFDGQVLTWAEYEEVERRYVGAFRLVCAALGVTELEIDDPWAGKPPPAWFPPFRSGVRVRLETVTRMVPRVLRGAVWCSFKGPGRTSITFGDDLYLYVRAPASVDRARDQIGGLGLYVVDLDPPDDELFDGEPVADFVGPADASFWARADRFVPAADEEVVVMERWARGPYGQRIRHAARPGEVSAVAHNVAPRSLVTVPAASLAAAVPDPDGVVRARWDPPGESP